MRSAAAGMDAQRMLLDVSARNIAAAQAAGPQGDFTRLVPKMRIVMRRGTAQAQFAGVRSEPAGDADALTEMVAVMNASRAYQADASLFDIGKQLAQREIELGKA